MTRSILTATAILLLSACSQEPQQDAPDAAASQSPSATPSPAATAPTATAPVTPSPSTTSPSPQPSLSVRDLGLTVGVYASGGSTCPPAMAGLATFDGSGFGSRNATQCMFTPKTRDGQTWIGTQTCTDTYSKARISEDLTITVASASRFTQENKWGRATFDLCPDEKLSDWTG